MSANTGTVKIEIQVDDKGTVKVKQFGDQVNKAGRKGEQSFKRTGRSVGDFNKKLTTTYGSVLKLSAAIGAIAGIAGLKGLASSFLDASKTTENFQVRLNILLGSVEEGSRLFEEMSDYAGKVPFQYQEIMGAATQLSGVMKGGVDQITQWMPLIGDLAAASGLSIQQTTEQVIRMYSAGAGAADLFRERGITAMLGFQAGVSYSAKETRQRLMDAWNAADSQFRGATESMAGTWDGMISMISDKWFKFRNLIMDAGVYEELKKQLDEINKKFGQWIKNNEALIKQKVPEYLDKITTSLKGLYGVYTSLPEGIVGATGYGLIGKMLFGKGMGQLIFVLKMLEPYFKKLPKWAQEFSVMLGGGIPPSFFEEGPAGAPKVRMKMPPYPEAPKTPETPDISALTGGATQDMWSTWAGAAEWGWEDEIVNYENSLVTKIDMTAEHFRQMKELTAGNQQEMAEIYRQSAAQIGAIENQKRQMLISSAQTITDRVAMAGRLLMSSSDKQSKALFAITKAAGISSAMVNTYKAVMIAKTATPWPPVNAALAAAELAFGLAQVANIKSQSYEGMGGGGGGGGGGGAVGTYPASPATGLPTFSAQTKKEEPPVIVMLKGDSSSEESFIDYFMDKFNIAVEVRGGRLVSTEIN